MVRCLCSASGDIPGGRIWSSSEVSPDCKRKQAARRNKLEAYKTSKASPLFGSKTGRRDFQSSLDSRCRDVVWRARRRIAGVAVAVDRYSFVGDSRGAAVLGVMDRAGSGTAS